MQFMYERLGQVIRARREAVGLDQAALAAQLDIGQQAVSGWERGHSRPRRAMLGDLARVLVVGEDALVDVGDYRSQALAVKSPVRPLARALPVEDLAEDRFEDLIADVMRTMYPDGHVSRYGGRGHKQHGIDVLVTADGSNLATGQCKRRRQFGPSAVEDAISEVTIDASNNYLFLSRLTATPASRDKVGMYPTWELWDGEDISRHIRSLPREQAVRLVDTYFPGHRESFLGVPAPGPWLHPEEYFDVTRATVFNHDWSLVGRQDLLDELIDVAYGAHVTVAFLVGAGGVGKTRLVKALVDHAPKGVHVRILPGDAHVSAADLELLPPESDLVVMVDDAHELVDVAGIVAGIWRRNRHSKVVLATRPYGLRVLKESLAHRGLLPEEHAEVTLGELDLASAEALAREALGGEASEAVTRRLAVLTVDSPLATVVGGVLINQGQLDPASLEQDENVRSHIMRGFRDALVRDPLAYDPSTRIAVLNALAAMQPFRTNEALARESLSAIVGKPYDELHIHLRGLEDAGILRRRGDSLRIVPDLLGDVILSEAAFDDANPLGTGYITRIEPLIAGSGAEHLFVNVCRVDWQVRDKREHAPSLVDSLWAAFSARIKAADIIGRRDLVETLAKVARFQPKLALGVSRWVIDNPTDRLDREHDSWRAVLAPNYNCVLEQLPSVLKRVALSADTVVAALNQLWELAARDERPTSQHPEHAARVLRELATFEVAKPLWFNERIVDVASTWFADDLRLSPFDVLEPMLATEGEESRFSGRAITFRPYSLEPHSIMRVRHRVIDLAFTELCSGDLARAGSATRALKAALRYPVGLFGREVSSEERDRWTPGFVATIKRLGAIAADQRVDPAVLVSIRFALHWHAKYGEGPAHDAARTVLAGMLDDPEARLALAVHDGWGHLIRDREDSYDAMEAKRLEFIQSVVAGLGSLTDHAVVDLLLTRLRAEREVHGSTEGHPGPVVVALIDARPTLAHAMLESVYANPSPFEFDSLLPVIISTLAEHDPAAAFAEITKLLGAGSEAWRRAAACAIGWNRGLRELYPGEFDLLLQLATDPDVVIRRNVTRAAHLLARSHRAEATRLLAALRFGDSAELAGDFFEAFHGVFGITWYDFSESERTLLRRDLIAVPEIEVYSVVEALAQLSARDPAWIIEMLKDRIHRAESLERIGDYRPLPYSWDEGLRVREAPDFLRNLYGVLSWIAAGVDLWQRRKMGAELFAAVAAGYDAQVIELLMDALALGERDMTLAVAAVLQEAPRTFIWDQPDFVSRALHAAGRLGDDIQREMAGALWGATISGGRSGTFGEPFPETIEQRDRSREVAKGLPAGSIEWRFYVDIAKSAERDIVREVSDDRLSDGRAW